MDQHYDVSERLEEEKETQLHAPTHVKHAKQETIMKKEERKKGNTQHKK